jgi:hypothetical protein
VELVDCGRRALNVTRRDCMLRLSSNTPLVLEAT